MGKLDELLKSGGANIAESMGAGADRAGQGEPEDLDGPRPLAGRGQEQERRRGAPRQDRPATRTSPARNSSRRPWSGWPSRSRREGSSSRSGCAGTRPRASTSSSAGNAAGGRPGWRGCATMSCVVVRGADRRRRAAGPPAHRELPPRGPAADRAGQGVQEPDGPERLVGQPGSPRSSASPSRPSSGPWPSSSCPSRSRSGWSRGPCPGDRLRDRQGSRSGDPAGTRRACGLGGAQPHRDDGGRPRRGQADAIDARKGQGGGPVPEGADVTDAEGGRVQDHRRTPQGSGRRTVGDRPPRGPRPDRKPEGAGGLREFVSGQR